MTGRPDRAPDYRIGPVSVWRRECQTSLEAQEAEAWIGDECVAVVESDAKVHACHTEYVGSCDGTDWFPVFSTFDAAESWMRAAIRRYLGAVTE